MAAHKKFTFDDPEDSYWNSNGTLTSALFGDMSLSSNTIAARAALEDLFDSSAQIGTDDLSSNPDSELQLNDAANMSNLTSGNQRRMLSEVGRFSSVKSAASLASEGSAGSCFNEPVSQLDYMRIKSEHHRLQKHLDQVKRDRYNAADPEVTVSRLRNGEPVSLDLYRSHLQKMNLLEAALSSLDGNAIIAVVLFLKRSMSESLFYDVLLRNPIATDHYLAVLKQTNQFETLITALSYSLSALGRFEDASMVEYSVACRQHTPEQKVYQLKKSLSNSFSNPALADEAKIVNEYIDLLERQIPVEAADEKAISSGSNEFVKFPKQHSLIDEPLYKTLFYCCLYHYDLPMNVLSSPLSLKELFQVNEKQFAWISISALSKLERWNDIEHILTGKKFFGGNKIFCPFSWTYLFDLLTTKGMPPKELLCKLLRAVPNIEERKKLAEKFPDASDVVMECIIAQKDRHGLGSFIYKLAP
uniref:Vps16_C domain-containing protein n=1 Tax=Syphacia muris TaxID=451379 RepID=A0A0N5AJU2_9BILA